MKKIQLVSMAMLCIAIALVSCSGEDGETGPQGPQGLAGLDGFDGVDGENGADGAYGVSCWDLNGNGTGDAEEDLNDDGNFDALDCQGADGTDGADGTNGTDGNANVQSLDIDISSWAGGTNIPFDIPIDAEVRPNYAFLFYMQFKEGQGNVIHPVPGINPLSTTITNEVYYKNDVASPNAYIYFVNTSDGSAFNFPGDLYERIIIVAIEKSTSGNKSAQESLITELKVAGIDMNDYHAVVEYFGLN